MLSGKLVVPILLGALVFAIALANNPTKKEAAMNPKPDAEIDVEGLGVATFGGGCFWCLEPVFEEIEGVKKVEVGYAGGDVENPSYEVVCSGRTGHAEVVQIYFDAEKIPFRKILDVFFSIHDPTTPNRQGADVGSQYRSIILYHNEDQKAAAEDVIKEIDASNKWGGPVVTQVVPFEVFYRAENYHQEYYRNNPNKGYCQIVISPKMEKFRRDFAPLLKSQFDADD